MDSIPSGCSDFSRGDKIHRAGKRGLYGFPKEPELKKPRSHRKGEAANRSYEVHATIRLPKNRRINIDRVLDSLLDAFAVEGSVKHIDAVFIRVYRGTGRGSAWSRP